MRTTLQLQLKDFYMTDSDNMPAQPRTSLSVSAIESIFQTSGCNIDVHVLETVDSTNTWLLEGELPAPITLCAAEHQTLGRGRRGKTWHSPDSGVTFSMRFNRHESVEQFNGLSLLAGAVLCDSLRAVGIADAKIKWPNDVLVNNAKLAGILIESRSVVPKPGTCIVVGMGINYKRGDEAQLIDQASTDLFALCGENGLPDRSMLIAEIAVRLAEVVTADVPAAVRGLAASWNNYDALAEAEVCASVAGGESVIGLAHGIDSSGGFRIQTEDGVRVFTSADISVRRR